MTRRDADEWPTARARSPAAPRSYHFPRFERRTLPNGMRLVVAPVHQAAARRRSSRWSRRARRGARRAGRGGGARRRSCCSRARPDSTARRSPTASSASAPRSTRTPTGTSATVSLTVLAERLPDALALVRDLLRAPDFPEREVARLKDERLAELLQLRAEPRGLADEQFSRAVYAADRALRDARPVGARRPSRRSDARTSFATSTPSAIVPAATTLVFAGDVSVDRAAALARTAVRRLAGRRRPAGDARRRRRGERRALVRVVAKADAPQSEVRVGHVGPAAPTPGLLRRSTVMNAVLGGLFSSRINLNLREAHGYTYGAFSAFEWRRAAGPFVVSIGRRRAT